MGEIYLKNRSISPRIILLDKGQIAVIFVSRNAGSPSHYASNLPIGEPKSPMLSPLIIKIVRQTTTMPMPHHKAHLKSLGSLVFLFNLCSHFFHGLNPCPCRAQLLMVGCKTLSYNVLICSQIPIPIREPSTRPTKIHFFLFRCYIWHAGQKNSVFITKMYQIIALPL